MSPRSVAAAVVAALMSAVLLHGVPGASAAHKLPANFKRCAAADPRVSDCLRQAVEDALRKMKDGVPSLGVLPVDPLRVNEINIDQGQQGSVSLRMHLTNISIFGLANTKITNYSASIEDGILRTETLTPTLRLQFNHVMSGRVLLLPIRGAGPGTLTMTDLVSHSYLKSAPTTKKDGRTYWNMQEYKVKFEPKSLSIDLQGLFSGRDGDRRVGDQLNMFINQNAALLFQETGGSFEEAFGAVFKEITSRVFSKVPFDDIFIVKQRRA